MVSQDVMEFGKTTERQNTLVPNSATRMKLFQAAADQINSFYEQLDDLRVTPDIEPETIRNYLSNFDFIEGHDAEELIGAVSERLRNWSLHTPHPGYYGLFNPAPSVYGMIADFLVAGFNPQMGAWHHSPFGVEIEAHLIRYFSNQFGIGSEAFGHFTSGGSEANFTSVVVALSRMFDGYAKSGARGLTGQPTIYCSAEFHHSFVKIAHQCGLGRDAIRMIPVNDEFVMDVDLLQRQVIADRASGMLPFMVVATAGTTNAGIVEPIDKIAAVARAQNLHLHVDAAWGGAVILSDKLKPVLKGIEHADSITFDPHKLLSVPMGAGMFLTRKHEWLRQAFGLTTDYVPESETDELDNYKHSFQFSRRFTGLKLFMTLATIGRAGYSEIIERQLELANSLATKLQSHGFAILNRASMGVVCFVPPADWEFDSHQKFEDLANKVCESGMAWISPTRLAGLSVMRACITSHFTRESDLDILVDAILSSKN